MSNKQTRETDEPMEKLPTRPTPIGPAASRTAPTSDPIEDEPRYVTVETAAAWAQRTPEMIRRFARAGVLDTIKDPEDGRRILVNDLDIAKLLRMKRRGWTTKTVRLTSATDGTTITRIIATPIRKEGSSIP